MVYLIHMVPEQHRQHPAGKSLEEYEQGFWEGYRQRLQRLYPDWTADQIEQRVEVGMREEIIKEYLQSTWRISELLVEEVNWGSGGEAKSEMVKVSMREKIAKEFLRSERLMSELLEKVNWDWGSGGKARS